MSRHWEDPSDPSKYELICSLIHLTNTDQEFSMYKMLTWHRNYSVD